MTELDDGRSVWDWSWETGFYKSRWERQGLGPKVFKDLETGNVREECLRARFPISEEVKATDSICDLQTSCAQMWTLAVSAMHIAYEKCPYQLRATSAVIFKAQPDFRSCSLQRGYWLVWDSPLELG